MSEAERLRADIELTRAELAETVTALQTRLDPHTLARRGVHQAAREAAARYGSAKSAAPVPLQRALVRIEVAATPLVSAAVEDRRRALTYGAAVVATLIILRRLLRHERVAQ